MAMDKVGGGVVGGGSKDTDGCLRVFNWNSFDDGHDDDDDDEDDGDEE